jgi:hypothetical protein
VGDASRAYRRSRLCRSEAIAGRAAIISPSRRIPRTENVPECSGTFWNVLVKRRLTAERTKSNQLLDGRGALHRPANGAMKKRRRPGRTDASHLHRTLEIVAGRKLRRHYEDVTPRPGSFTTRRGRPRLHGIWLIWLEVVCLIVVALTHVAEAFYIFPSMGWGLPDSPGHYLDLMSAVFGLPLLVAGLVVRAINTVAQKSQPTTKRIVTPCGLKTNRTSL